jgi:hypothetical protein
MDHAQSLKFLDDLDKTGATEAKVTGHSETRDKEGNPGAVITELMVTMPSDPAARKQVWAVREGLEKKLGMKPEMVQVETGGREEEPKKHEPMKDWGQKLVTIRLVKGYDFEALLNKSGKGADDEGDDEEEEGEAKSAAPAPADGSPAPQPTAPADGAAPTPAAQPAPADAPF